MIRNRFSEEQIIGILKEHEAGVAVSELCRKHGVSDASIYRMKTPMACCGSTFQKEPILAFTLQQNWMQLPTRSTQNLGKHSAGKRLQKFSTDSLQSSMIEMLRRSFKSTQYTSEQFRQLMANNGVTCMMIRSGNVWDNAPMESFFSTLKTERLLKSIVHATTPAPISSTSLSASTMPSESIRQSDI